MSFILPSPPKSIQTKNPELYDWMQDVKGKLEKSHVLSAGIPLTAPQAGDMVYKAPLAWARLSVGSPGQIMTQGTSTAPVWSGASSIIDTVFGTAQGSVLYRGTSSWAALAPGTNGQFLQTQGTSANPQWAGVSPSGTAGGYLFGSYPNPNVIKVLGVSTNGTAAIGDVGEYISQSIASGTAVSLSSGTAATVTSIILTPGDWDVAGNVAFIGGAATTASVFSGGIGTAAATMPTAPGAGAFSQFPISVSAGGAEPCFPVGEMRLSLAGTSTAYLVGQASFAVSTMGAYGFIGARRRR